MVWEGKGNCKVCHVNRGQCLIALHDDESSSARAVLIAMAWEGSGSSSSSDSTDPCLKMRWKSTFSIRQDPAHTSNYCQSMLRMMKIIFRDLSTIMYILTSCQASSPQSAD